MVFEAYYRGFRFVVVFAHFLHRHAPKEKLAHFI